MLNVYDDFSWTFQSLQCYNFLYITLQLQKCCASSSRMLPFSIKFVMNCICYVCVDECASVCLLASSSWLVVRYSSFGDNLSVASSVLKDCLALKNWTGNLSLNVGVFTIKLHCIKFSKSEELNLKIFDPRKSKFFSFKIFILPSIFLNWPWRDVWDVGRFLWGRISPTLQWRYGYPRCGKCRNFEARPVYIC